jgi:glycosyltransferase involved in cell wall biosynthesis
LNGGTGCLGILLKGYPRISESFISSEILLLESLGIPIRIFSIRQPREGFSHDHVKRIKARATYLPEYVLPNLKTLYESNARLHTELGSHYRQCFIEALKRALERKKTATVRHFLQGGHLAATRLPRDNVVHIHAHFAHTPASVALFASELTGIPFSFTAHAKDIYTSEPDQVARKIRKARFVVTCTAYNAEYLRGLRDAVGATTPIHTIYHGIDLNLFRYDHSPPSPPPYRILSVGRLVEKKGYDDLLQAVKLLDACGLDFEFVHIGSGELEGSIRKMIGELRLSHRVKLLGTLVHREVLSWYRKSHCVALACKVAGNGDRDGIPNVLVEAMAVGCPVVATRVSAIPELVEHGATGSLVEPKNPSAMAHAILEVLLNGDRFQSHRQLARRRVEDRFDSSRCIVKLHALFREVLEGQ